MNIYSKKIAVIAAYAMIYFPTISMSAQLTVDRAECERLICPLGIDVAQPELGWTLLSDQRGAQQTAYQILVASDPALLTDGKADLWDSGKVSSKISLGITYKGKSLSSGKRAFWQVRVWDAKDQPSAFSAPQWWEMGKLTTNDWQAKWISDGRPQPESDEAFYAIRPAPLLRKNFALKGPVKQARIYVAGLGYQEVHLNGNKVGDHQLDTAWTCYDKRISNSTFDVTKQLQQGNNAIGLILGNGWFNPLPLRFWGQRNFRTSLAVGRPQAILELLIDYVDGSSEKILTDQSWKSSDGPILRNNIYLGEVYDARKEITGWATPDFDAGKWKLAVVETNPLGKIEAQSLPPIRVTEEIPAKLNTTGDTGPFIYDFGVNFTGVVRYKFKAPAGTQYVIRYGELLHKDGTLNPMTSVAGQIKGLRKDGSGQSVGGPGAPEIAWQGDTYIAKGDGEETYTPRFTFHGFRYAEISARPIEVTGLRLHTDVQSVGTFSCSNENLNRIQEMCRRTFVSNIIGVQSDCPHRERLAYGGDIVATSEAFLMNYDMHSFYRKTVRDWADSARPDGMFTDTSPFVGINYCGIGWAMTHPLLLSQLYQYHGDRRLIEEQYEASKRWLLLVEKQNPLGTIKGGLSDHESLVPAPVPPLVTPLYFQCATMVADMAKVLGKADDETYLRELAKKIATVYQQQFFDPKTGKAGPGSQASQAFALQTGIMPASTHPQLVDWLVKDIRDQHQGHLSTGIFGTKFMLESLSANGQAETAYGIVNQPDMPGWRWMMDNGATTLWEHWAGSDNTFSQNHPMFGSVSQWFFQWLGGIRPAADAVGFDKILIAPQPCGDLTWATSEYKSCRGLIKSSWKKDNSLFTLKVTIPVGATATVFIPAKDAASVSEGSKPASTAEGIKFLRMERGAAVFAIGSGSYEFSSR
jgi:alpha-L-rhamnosidase